MPTTTKKQKILPPGIPHMYHTKPESLLTETQARHALCTMTNAYLMFEGVS